MAASSLLDAVGRLQLKEETSLDDDIDNLLSQQRPKRQKKRSPSFIKRKLEDDFLAPPTSFSPEWLNKLQQYVYQSSKY